MKANLVESLRTAHTDVTGFMLLKIDLPNSFEAAIVLTEVVKEQEKTMTTKRQVSLITQETSNIEARGQASIMTINANATSVATQRLNEGAGKVSKQNIEYTALALKEVQSKLAFSNPKVSLLKYYMYQRVGSQKVDSDNQLNVGMQATVMQT